MPILSRIRRTRQVPDPTPAPQPTANDIRKWERRNLNEERWANQRPATAREKEAFVRDEVVPEIARWAADPTLGRDQLLRHFYRQDGAIVWLIASPKHLEVSCFDDHDVYAAIMRMLPTGLRCAFNQYEPGELHIARTPSGV